MQDKVLICFTASYPYGLKETFFDNEIPYLAKAFDKVIIFPKYNPTKSLSRRKLPENVICYSPLVSSNKVIRLVQGLLNLSPITLYLNDFFKFKVFKSKANLFSWLNSLLVFRRSYQKFRTFLNYFNGDSDFTLYSYWAEAPIFTTDLCKPYTKVVRMHRADFYLEENHGYLPLREDIYQSADLLAPISLDIVDKLKTFYKVKDDKIKLARLGTHFPNEIQRQCIDNYANPIRIVSCSRVDPVKRVHKIAESLKGHRSTIPIEWHHFGNGIEFDRLKVTVKDLPAHVKVNLHGWATQHELFDFYEQKHVTWFLNVSRSEGIPVSIMEAISFGIPIIATDVGGTNEIVSDLNGYLIDKEFEPVSLLRLILDCEGDSYIKKRENSMKIWQEQYKAENNYPQFVAEIMKLKS